MRNKRKEEFEKHEKRLMMEFAKKKEAIIQYSTEIGIRLVLVVMDRVDPLYHMKIKRKEEKKRKKNKIRQDRNMRVWTIERNLCVKYMQK